MHQNKAPIKDGYKTCSWLAYERCRKRPCHKGDGPDEDTRRMNGPDHGWCHRITQWANIPISVIHDPLLQDLTEIMRGRHAISTCFLSPSDRVALSALFSLGQRAKAGDRG